MKAPIIIFEHGDVTFFETVTKAQIGIEPIDVVNNEYVAYDSDGRLLSLAVEQIEKPSFLGKAKSIEIVKISETKESPVHSDDFRKLLLQFFMKTEVYDQTDESLSLGDLVDKAVKQFGYTG
jgi:hypothetical protein